MFSAAAGVHMPPVVCRDDISRGGNVDFAVFFAFRPWTKRRFCHFLYFCRGGNVDFADFRISAMAETSFFSFSARPSSRTDKNREIWH